MHTLRFDFVKLVSLENAVRDDHIQYIQHQHQLLILWKISGDLIKYPLVNHLFIWCDRNDECNDTKGRLPNVFPLSKKGIPSNLRY